MIRDKIETERYTLYLGDCLDVLPTIAPGSVDAVVTDPPYGINRSGQQETFTRNPKHKRKHHEDKEWDKCRPSSQCFAMMLSVAKDAIIWGGNYFSDLLPPSMGWLYWDKGQKGLSMSDGELAWTSRQAALRSIFCNRCELIGSLHPTQKPLRVMLWSLSFLPHAETILDPFMGSGTTGVAAMKLGRRFIGVEIDEKYFAIAHKRIAEAAEEPPLFKAAREAEQATLFEGAQ